jgi:hypothetical protein
LVRPTIWNDQKRLNDETGARDDSNVRPLPSTGEFLIFSRVYPKSLAAT